MANSGKTLQTRIQLKHDTNANWTTAGNNGFIPLAGEVIVYDDLGPKVKIGNGTTNVKDLSWVALTPTEVNNGLALKANKADIAATAMQGTATQNNTHWKIHNFGDWGTGTWMTKGFNMLISSRAGETIWVSLAANDSNTSAEAIRLVNRYSKIAAIYYMASENALYVTAAGWANNICAHILSNVNGDYVPSISSASEIPSGAVAIQITEFGANSAGAVVGRANGTLSFSGSGAAPTYNGANLALASDVNTRVAKAGDTMTGCLQINVTNNPYIGLNDGTTNWYFQAVQNEQKVGLGPTWAQATKWDTAGNMTIPGNISCAGGNVYTSGNVLYGAAWNDYAEYRETPEYIEPGRVVCENNDDTLSLSEQRLQPGAEIVSDTFGFAIGETEQCKTPIAVSGRVLAYPYEDRNTYKPGDAVCAGPEGTVSKMTREEIREYPERIIGTVSAVPEYETWGQNNVPVNERIWIRIK